MNAPVECQICTGTLVAGRTAAYRRCRVCGHEYRVLGVQPAEMNNERLTVTAVQRRSALDRYQDRVVAACAVSRDLLLDVGSGSGRFLHRQRQHFDRVLGIEVSEASRTFAREHLGLRIEPQMPGDLRRLSLVTFWHSLEHIEMSTIAEMFEQIRAASTADTRVIVCVPNAGSHQFRALGEHYAYYDVLQHPHQFTQESLDRLMHRHGLVPARRFHSFPYSAFGYLQGMLNCVGPVHNYLYYRVKRGTSFALSASRGAALDACNAALGVALAPLAATLAVTDLLSTATAGVLTACYRSEH